VEDAERRDKQRAPISAGCLPAELASIATVSPEVQSILYRERSMHQGAAGLLIVCLFVYNKVTCIWTSGSTTARSN
jgi:hypothetical protein